ncbi:hypothetical protein A2300_01265 [Candidatus Falkowbacteria bacterium RIFOXYB2_FULL_35_7]|nr:MAG: hypothetical protein A2300_01265 [Candidatus Falkowbacteria bacterium RIFOXYB2_FULL_35_7]
MITEVKYDCCKCEGTGNVQVKHGLNTVANETCDKCNGKGYLSTRCRKQTCKCSTSPDTSVTKFFE